MHFLKSAVLSLLGIALVSTFASLPACADADHFTVRIGVMHVDGETQLNGRTNGGTNTIGYRSEHFDFGKRSGPRLEGVFHFSDRNRVLFNYFRYDRGRQFALDHDVDIDGSVVPAGSTASTHTRFDLGSLVYDYAITETPTTSIGLQVGAAWADVDGRVRATDASVISNNRERESGVAPVLGLRWTSNTRDQRWSFTVQGQYVNANWGSLDAYGGNLTRINALGEYRFTRNFGLYLGYDLFRLNVDHDFGQANGGVDLRFKGPMAGVTLAF